jgi:hypothetical protein
MRQNKNTEVLFACRALAQVPDSAWSQRKKTLVNVRRPFTDFLFL